MGERGNPKGSLKMRFSENPELSKTDMARLIRKGVMEHTQYSGIITALSPFADAIPRSGGCPAGRYRHRSG